MVKGQDQTTGLLKNVAWPINKTLIVTKFGTIGWHKKVEIHSISVEVLLSGYLTNHTGWL